MIEGAIATAESRQIRVDDLPVSLRGGYGEHLVPSYQLGDTDARVGEPLCAAGARKNAGNKRQACRALDISYHTLNSYLRYRPADARACQSGIRASWCRRRAEQLGCRKPPALEDERGGAEVPRGHARLRRLGIDMQQTSRRQFVAASLAGLPMLAHCERRPRLPFAPQAARCADRARAYWSIRCWIETITTAARAGRRRGRQAVPSRKASARAIGSHPRRSGRAHRPALRSHAGAARLRRRQARVGRAALIDEMVRSARDHKRHVGDARSSSTRRSRNWSRAGSRVCLRDLQRCASRRRASTRRTPSRQRRFGPAQFDFCADVRMTIELAEVAAGIICSIAVLEPTWRWNRSARRPA